MDPIQLAELGGNGVAMLLFLYFGLKPTTPMTDLGLTGAKFAKLYKALEVAKT